MYQAERFLGQRLCIVLSSPHRRNTLLRQLHLSKAREGQWANLNFAARLTSHEESMRRKVLTAFKVQGNDPNDRSLNKAWIAGRRVQLNGNVADIIIGQHPMFRINLALHETMVE